LQKAKDGLFGKIGLENLLPMQIKNTYAMREVALGRSSSGRGQAGLAASNASP
jgi:hypothetical protein